MPKQVYQDDLIRKGLTAEEQEAVRQDAKRRGYGWVPTQQTPPLPVAGRRGGTDPLGMLAQERQRMTEIAQTEAAQTSKGPVFKTMQDVALAGGAAYFAPAMMGAMPIFSGLGQLASDIISQTPPEQTALNVGLATAIPGAAEFGSRILATAPGIPRAGVTEAIRESARGPTGLEGGLITRPFVGASRTMEQRAGKGLGRFASAQMSKRTAIPLVRQQVAEAEAIIGEYRDAIIVDAEPLRRLLLGKENKFIKGLGGEADAMRASIAQRIDEVAYPKGGQLDLGDVVQLIDEIDATVKKEFMKLESPAKISALKELRRSVRKALSDAIPDEAARAHYESIMTTITQRMDARDELVRRLGRTFRLKGETRFMGEESIIRSVDEPTRMGDLTGELLREFDRTHNTNYFKRAKRLKAIRRWNPDDRKEASGILGLFRALITPVVRPAAAVGAPLAGAAPRYLPILRGIAGGELGVPEIPNLPTTGLPQTEAASELAQRQAGISKTRVSPQEAARLFAEQVR